MVVEEKSKKIKSLSDLENATFAVVRRNDIMMSGF